MMAGRMWWKSIDRNPNSTRQAYNVIPMGFPPQFDRPIHWDDAWLNWVEIHWDDAQFDQALIIGQIVWSNWSNWVEIHWDDAWSNWSNLVEIHWDYAWSNWSNLVVELGGNPLRLHCMPAWSNWVVELSGNPLRLCLVESVEFGGWIGWKSIEIMPNSTGH